MNDSFVAMQCIQYFPYYQMQLSSERSYELLKRRTSTIVNAALPSMPQFMVPESFDLHTDRSAPPPTPPTSPDPHLQTWPLKTFNSMDLCDCGTNENSWSVTQLREAMFTPRWQSLGKVQLIHHTSPVDQRVQHQHLNKPHTGNLKKPHKPIM